MASNSQELQNLVNYGLVKAHVAMGLIFFIIVATMGFLYSLQLDGIYPFPGIEFLSPGRIRMLIPRNLIKTIRETTLVFSL